jgi:hypothetical protein
MMAELIAESASRLSLMESTVLGRKKLLPEEEQAALDYVLKRSDSPHTTSCSRYGTDLLPGTQQVTSARRTAVTCMNEPARRRGQGTCGSPSRSREP